MSYAQRREISALTSHNFYPVYIRLSPAKITSNDTTHIGECATERFLRLIQENVEIMLHTRLELTVVEERQREKKKR